MACCRAILFVMAWAACAAWAGEGDWPWWRGPNKNGSAAAGPPLADAWGPDGPPLLWRSEPVMGGFNGGMGSITVADGRAYVYANWTVNENTPARRLTDAVLDGLGRLPRTIPADLAKSIEEARLSDELAGLGSPQARAFAANWVDAHLTAEQKQEFGQEVKARIAQGRSGLSPAELKKLETIAGRQFPSAEEMKHWLRDNGLTDASASRVMAAVPARLPVTQDTILCMDAATGKTIWRKDYPGWAYSYASSATVTLAGGRAYFAGSYRTAYCLDAATGKLLWQAMTQEQPNRICSAVLVVDKLAILLGDSLTAHDIDTGEEVWRNPRITGGNNSPVLWSRGGRNYVLVNTSRECDGPGLVFCVDPASGETLWTVPGGSFSTVALEGDTMVVMSGGLAAYRLDGDRPPEKLWSAPGGDRGASPVICNGLVFAIGGWMRCVDLKTGQAAWSEKGPGSNTIASPSAADGKVFYNAQEGRSFIMVKATPDKYTLLAETKALGVAPCSSPTIVGKRLYLRLKDCVACFDLACPPAKPGLDPDTENEDEPAAR
jgi:outer membrane protein assembly factor BamB